MPTLTGDLRTTQTLRARVTGRAAADVTLDEPVGGSPFLPSARQSTVTGVRYYPDLAITGADTNSLTLSLLNAGPAGTGTTVIATIALNTAAGVKNKNVPIPLTLSGTPANLDVAYNDILVWRSEKVGTGLLDPGGAVEVDLLRA